MEEWKSLSLSLSFSLSLIHFDITGTSLQKEDPVLSDKWNSLQPLLVGAARACWDSPLLPGGEGGRGVTSNSQLHLVKKGLNYVF